MMLLPPLKRMRLNIHNRLGDTLDAANVTKNALAREAFSMEPSPSNFKEKHK